MKNLILILVLIFSIFSLSVSGEDYAGWTVGENGVVYGTIDSGNTWIRQGSNQIADAHMYGVFAVDTLTAWIVGDLNTGYATIYNTVDGGQTWTRKGFGQTALQGFSLNKVHVSSNTVWAVEKGAILRSSDNGNSWTNCIPTEYTNTPLQGVFSINGNIVWVSGGGTNDSDFATMLKTTNAGQSWVRQTGGGITNANHFIGIFAANTQTLWAVGGKGFLIYRSDDGGDSWAKQPSQGGLGDANEVYAVDTQTVWVACDNFIEWTHDGGSTWSNKTTTYYTMGVCAVNKQEAWAAVCDDLHNTGYVWHTSNGGETWEEQISSPPPLETISFALDPVPEPAFLFLIFNLGFLILWKKSK